MSGEIKEKKTFAVLGYSKGETTELVDALNRILANYEVHYQKLRNYHWNVRGDNFFDLHDLFEEQYNESKKHIDDIAERIRVFGHTPLSTFKDFLNESSIKETGTDLSDYEMISEILSDYRVLLDFMNEAITKADDIDDAGTENLLKGFINKIEKHHWMLMSFSEKTS